MTSLCGLNFKIMGDYNDLIKKIKKNRHTKVSTDIDIDFRKQQSKTTTAIRDVITPAAEPFNMLSLQPMRLICELNYIPVKICLYILHCCDTFVIKSVHRQTERQKDR